MTVLLEYANNANTTLASGITNSQTTLAVASSTGGEFPAIGSGPNEFYCTITDAATDLLREIVLVTDRSGDTFTIVRAQQGTTARAYLAGDYVQQLVTAGDLANFVQASQLPSVSPGGTSGNVQFNNGTSALGGAAHVNVSAAGDALEVGSPTGGMPAPGGINAGLLYQEGVQVETIEASSLAGTGFRQMSPDGYMEQWGIVNVTTVGVITVNFPVAFTSACYTVMLQPCSGNIGSPALDVVPSPTKTQFQFFYNGVPTNLYFRANGV